MPALLLAFRRDTVTSPHSNPGERAESFYTMKANHVILAALLERGANPDLIDDHGNTPLSLAAEWHDASTVELLLRNGADPNHPGEEGLTALMTAVIFDSNPESNQDVMRALLAAGANINAQETAEGNTALMYAVNNGSVETVQFLLERGADVNFPDHGGATPLAIAKQRDWDRTMPQVIAVLERAGAKE